ncbi:MAG: hypothetical protein AAGA56_18480 [Myxococcota bacterium]
MPARAECLTGSAVAIALTVASSSASAEPGPDSPRPPEDAHGGVPSPDRRALAVTTSVVPGLILHGAGHYTLGRRRTAYRLLAAEGLGFGALLVGGGVLVFTGANRYLTAPAAATTIAGVGLIGMSFFADVIGTAWPLESRGEATLRRPRVEAELGYRAIHDPQFAYAHLVKQRVDVALFGWRISPEMWLALDDTNARLRMELAYRPWGPRVDRAADDGSFFEVRAAFTHHRYGGDGFRTLTSEIAGQGRLDLARIDPWLTGQFAEFELGLAVQTFDYDLAGVQNDNETLLLSRFAHGVYIGRPDRPPYGEASYFYDHRHDTYAGGLNGIAIGAPGFFGLDARVYATHNWGIRADIAAGAATLGGLSLLVRLPPRP